LGKVSLIFLGASILLCFNSFSQELKDEIRIPDKWELILETETSDELKVLQTMQSFRDNNSRKLFGVNRDFCLCKEVWRSYLEENELLETAIYLPLAFSFKSTSTNCSEAEKYFIEMGGFSGKSSEYISHLKSMWGSDVGFNDMLYDYRIIIRLLENLNLPQDCKKTFRTHKVKDGETLYRLSVTYGVSIEKIQNANSLGSSTSIKSGSILVIP
tara:strand:- start:4145 stop:4786 length:642 start_codon:yes stop_codon:yes gene_type:complete